MEDNGLAMQNRPFKQLLDGKPSTPGGPNMDGLGYGPEKDEKPFAGLGGGKPAGGPPGNPRPGGNGLGYAKLIQNTLKFYDPVSQFNKRRFG